MAQHGPERGEPGPKQVVAKERVRPAAGAPGRIQERHAIFRFRSFTGDLHRLADWLVACRIATVAMASTGVYWIALHEILEARGIRVVVANARDVKPVPGRKTDVNDARWLQQLHAYGLLRGSFHPPGDIAPCAPTCAGASVCSTVRPPISSTCRKRRRR
ncbi:IS110 family transposase [Thiocapsa roseopersicina]|uniref:IS110 family transposase n=1 Tax=Thiocapsa roseopersicina TaxID=1058 RepID=UPI001C312310|nr:transposase [Thiocapsa roseopersicina]